MPDPMSPEMLALLQQRADLRRLAAAGVPPDVAEVAEQLIRDGLRLPDALDAAAWTVVKVGTFTVQPTPTPQEEEHGEQGAEAARELSGLEPR